MRGDGCASCEDCEAFDLTAASGGRATCKLGTRPMVRTRTRTRHRSPNASTATARTTTTTYYAGWRSSKRLDGG